VVSTRTPERQACDYLGSTYLPTTLPADSLALLFYVPSEIYATALRKCKEINQELNSDPFGEKQRHHGRLTWGRASKSRVANAEQPKPYDASRIKELVEQETDRIETAQESSNGDAEWTAKVKDVGYGVIKFAQVLKPVIDVLVPQSPEYTVPYACVWIVFKGFLARKEKKDSVPDLIKSLSEDLPLFNAYQVLAPTDLMKSTLAELYIHSADFVWRLAEYYSHGFFAYGWAVAPDQVQLRSVPIQRQKGGRAAENPL
jgi:hypothetical protein